MKKIAFFILLIVAFSFISASIKVSCPEQVELNKEFYCSINSTKDLTLSDIKIYISGNGSILNKIWDGATYQRGDWYAKETVQDKESQVLVKINKTFCGEIKIDVKLREHNNQKIYFTDTLMSEIVCNAKIEENSTETAVNSTPKDIKIIENNSNLTSGKSLAFISLIIFTIILVILIIIQKRSTTKNEFRKDPADDDN
jgi:hypothetical protein